MRFRTMVSAAFCTAAEDATRARMDRAELPLGLEGVEGGLHLGDVLVGAAAHQRDRQARQKLNPCEFHDGVQTVGKSAPTRFFTKNRKQLRPAALAW